MEHNIHTPSRPDVPTALSNATRLSDVKPTRIPLPRTRTASSSGQAQALGLSRTESRNGGHSSHHNLHRAAPSALLHSISNSNDIPDAWFFHSQHSSASVY